MPQPLFSHVLNLQKPGFRVAFVTASALISSRVTIGNTAGGNITLTLPPAKSYQGRDIIVVKNTNDANTVTVQVAPGDGITYSIGSASITLTVIDQKAWLVSDGASTWTKMI